VSHPSLGRPPLDQTAGDPAAAAALRRSAGRLAARALEEAVAADPTLRERTDDLRLQRFLRDLETLLGKLAVATGEPEVARAYAESTVPIFRRRTLSADDVINGLEGIRRAAAAVVAAPSMPAVDAAIDAMIEAYRWHRRLAGDGHRRNPVAAFIYKGA
jgi:hypothetical protein